MASVDVQKQITHMTRFIEQEAQEKADEIQTKAEEEFSIEKGRLVQEEKIKIGLLYERRYKQVDIKKKIFYSNKLNEARLEVLRAQDGHLKQIFADARTRLETFSKDTSKYTSTLENLLTQGLLALLEKKVVLRCRKSDVAILKSVVPKSLAAVKSKVNIDVEVSINEADPLPDTCGGGVELSTFGDRIKIVNTLENRLDQAAHQVLPALRNMLFGASPSRKFFD
eukprot:m.123036 g.123036  ORF g.123036 m.123036 type:complete len:225 (-) comp52138_c0_seq1:227-901(-)